MKINLVESRDLRRRQSNITKKTEERSTENGLPA
jgi:hypothetical protein